jgi:hypothetical protein
MAIFRHGHIFRHAVFRHGDIFPPWQNSATAIFSATDLGCGLLRNMAEIYLAAIPRPPRKIFEKFTSLIGTS